jgi:hypothetical protein
MHWTDSRDFAGPNRSLSIITEITCCTARVEFGAVAMSLPGAVTARQDPGFQPRASQLSIVALIEFNAQLRLQQDKAGAAPAAGRSIAFIGRQLGDNGQQQGLRA